MAIKHTLRSLRRDPGLVAGVVLTFAIAIGANAAMYGLVSRLLLPTPPGLPAGSASSSAVKYRPTNGRAPSTAK